MPLKLTLRPSEEIIVNGCVIKNGDRRATIVIQNRSDVIRGQDIMAQEDADTPVKEIYFLIQTALIHPKARDEIVPHIQERLAYLTKSLSSAAVSHVFEAANYVSSMNYYQALRSMKNIMKIEPAA